MGNSELTTAKYFEQAERERFAAEAAAAAAVEATPVPSAPPDLWASVYRWGSMGIGVAFFVCVVALAIPLLTSTGSHKRTNAIDWMLWMGGAQSDQTFEKFLRDSAEASQREWDERYRESPAYQFNNSTQFNAGQLDFTSTPWRPDPSPPPRGRR